MAVEQVDKELADGCRLENPIFKQTHVALSLCIYHDVIGYNCIHVHMNMHVCT